MEPQRDHPQGLDRLYPRESFRSIDDMERSELVVLADRMDVAVDADWGTERLRRIIGEHLTD